MSLASFWLADLPLKLKLKSKISCLADLKPMYNKTIVK